MDAITPVSAVSECSRNELVMYGVSVPTVPEVHVSINSISHTLSKVS